VRSTWTPPLLLLFLKENSENLIAYNIAIKRSGIFPREAGNPAEQSWKMTFGEIGENAWRFSGSDPISRLIAVSYFSSYEQTFPL